MRLSLDTGDRSHLIRAYGEGWIIVNEIKITQSVLVTPQQLIADWPPQRFDALQADHFERLLVLEPEIRGRLC